MTVTTSKARISKGRARILGAAKDLLWERGYEHMSPRDVLERSGAGQGSLYHHFSGKMEMAQAALDEMVAEESAAVDAIFSPDKPPVQRLSDYLTRQRAALKGCRVGRLANETVMEQPALREGVARYLGHVEELITQAIREGQQAGTLRPDMDAQALGAMVLSVIEGGYILARAHWDGARMARALAGAEALLAAVTLPPE